MLIFGSALGKSFSIQGIFRSTLSNSFSSSARLCVDFLF